MYAHLLAGLLALSSLKQFRIHCLGVGSFHDGLSLTHSLITKAIFYTVPTGQYNVDNFSLRLSSAVILSCVKFAMKTNQLVSETLGCGLLKGFNAWTYWLLPDTLKPTAFSSTCSHWHGVPPKTMRSSNAGLNPLKQWAKWLLPRRTVSGILVIQRNDSNGCNWKGEGWEERKHFCRVGERTNVSMWETAS